MADDRAIREAADIVKHASEPRRLKLMLLLAERDRSVGELCAMIPGAAQPAISHHLMVLRLGRMVDFTRDGKSCVYTITVAGRRLLEAVETLMGGD